MDALVLLVTGPIPRRTLPRLCERVREVLRASGAEMIVCDVGAMDPPDGETVDTLARLQLTALRMGRRVRFLDASGTLRDLVTFSGLADVVPCDEVPFELGG